MRFAGARINEINRNRNAKDKIKDNQDRIEKYRMPIDKSENNSLDEIRVEMSKILYLIIMN